jgi:hypothetical protein
MGRDTPPPPTPSGFAQQRLPAAVRRRKTGEEGVRDGGG